MNRIKICKKIILTIQSCISNPTFLNLYKKPHSFIRQRKLTMFLVIHYIFYTNKAPLSQNLSNIIDDLFPLSFPSVSKQALSKARQHIDFSLFRDLFSLSVDLFYKNTPKRKLWHGYHIFAIDGSRIQVPNSSSNFLHFGQFFTKNPSNDSKKYYSMGLASLVYDVLDDYIIHGSLEPYLTSERELALDHLKVIEDLGIYQDSIVIFDRGYYSEKMFAYCA